MPSKPGQHQKSKQRSHSESSDKQEQEQTAGEREAQADTQSLRWIVAGLFLLTVLLAFHTVYVHQWLVSPLQSELIELRKKTSEVHTCKFSRSANGEFTMSNLKIPNFQEEKLYFTCSREHKSLEHPYIMYCNTCCT